MLKKIYDFIEVHILDNTGLGAMIFCILFLFMFTASIIALDHEPATKNDYEPLIKQQETISKDFNKLYTYDNYEVVPAKDSIKVTLKNDECKLICAFDKELSFLGYSKVDEALSLMQVIIVSFIIAIITGAGIAGLIIYPIPALLMFLLKIIEKMCLLLTGGESNNGIKL